MEINVCVGRDKERFLKKKNPFLLAKGCIETIQVCTHTCTQKGLNSTDHKKFTHKSTHRHTHARTHTGTRTQARAHTHTGTS